VLDASGRGAATFDEIQEALAILRVLKLPADLIATSEDLGWGSPARRSSTP
jgi:hypothetical protein